MCVAGDPSWMETAENLVLVVNAAPSVVTLSKPIDAYLEDYEVSRSSEQTHGKRDESLIYGSFQ